MTFVVGLTGGIGSGKSVVAEFFGRRGVAIVDTDAIAHELTSPGGTAIEAIRESFGPEFVTADGALDRVRMRGLVFRDPQSKQRLERILHPRIHACGQERAENAHGPYAMLVVPLLVETGVDRARYQRVLVVDCSEDTQVMRVMQRSGLPEDEVRRIIATQAGRRERLDVADDVIDNSGGFDELEPQVEHLHALYVDLARERGRRGG